MATAKARTKTSARDVRALEFLSRVGILEDLDQAELAEVHAIAERVEVPAGTVIMREGEPGDEMYLFVAGEVTISKNLTLKLGKGGGFSQAEKSMVTLEPDSVSFFGEMAIIENAPRSATVTAATDCVISKINRDDFEKLCSAYPQIGFKILRRVAMVLSKRVRDGNQDMLKLTTALSIAISR